MNSTKATKKGASSGTDWIAQETVLMQNHPTTLFESPRTGLRGLVLHTAEPLCSLHVAIATCATTNEYSHKDDGLPHTLEHAIFLGSELYPYKGILDKLANRSLADGTNAWTATDATVYTLTTAGEEGALNLLPIYADHILHPTLTDESFVTEVHHITAEGKDKGVVYCEMQGRENTDGSLVDRAILDLLYPHNCGYSAETGGKLKNLRTLQNSAVQRYHRENYTPNNMLFVLSGNVDAADFFRQLDQVEDRLLRRAGGKNSGQVPRRAQRPWIHDAVPELDHAAVGLLPAFASTSAGGHDNKNARELSFPSEDESRGTISMAWRGPAYEDHAKWIQLRLLWTYLTDSAAAPLQKALVECEEPLCADVGPAHEIFTQGYHQVWFHEVDVPKMEAVAPAFWNVLQNVATESFDMDRMHMVIRRRRRELLEFLERRPTDALIDAVIRNFLFAQRKQGTEMTEMEADVDELPFLAEALGLGKSVWLGLLQEYILQQPYALVLGRPSAALARKMAQDEKEREAKQAQDLGPEKLQELGATLDAAIAFNEREIPEEILTNFPVPSLDKVKAVPVLTIRGVGEGIEVARNSGRGVAQEEIDLVLSKLRTSASLAKESVETFHVDWNHIESAFLYTCVGLSTKDLTSQQRLYLDLLLELAFKLPATIDDGTVLSKDEFVSQLQDDTVSYRARVGLLGGISQMISFSVQMENTDGQGLASSLKWIRRVLYQTTLTTETVKMAAQKLLSEIPPQIRHGPTICRAVSDELNFQGGKSNKVAVSALRQWPFLDELVKRMEDPNGAEEVVAELQAIKDELVQTQNMQVFVAGNLKNVPNPMQTLADALRPPGVDSDTKGTRITNVSALSVRSNSTGRAAICSLSAIESSFLSVTSPGVGAYDPNHAALLVAMEYLTALEGDFWVKIRGAGLSYGSSINNHTESQLLKFGLFKCTDICAAFAAASQILVDYASGAAQISTVGLESAKSSLAYSIISSGVSTKLGASMNAWTNHYEGKGVDYDQWLLAQVGRVTLDEALHALVTYLIPLFDPQSNLVVTCPTNKVEEIRAYFVERGWKNVQKVPEDELCKAFFSSSSHQTMDESEQEEASLPPLPEAKPGVSMFLPGAFAAQFQCSCIRCVR